MSFDLLIMHGVDDTGDSAQPVTLSVGRPSKAINGIQKGAQNWLMALLTARGTSLGDLTYGSDFLPSINTGNTQNTEYVSAIFDDASADIRDWFFANVYTPTTPADEMINGAELTSIEAVADTLIIKITLTSRAGETRTYTTPIKYI